MPVVFHSAGEKMEPAKVIKVIRSEKEENLIVINPYSANVDNMASSYQG